MTQTKKRIMWCGEASFLSTGFSTYSLEVLGRLQETGKYELMEFASYGALDDPRSYDLPWKYKSCMYRKGDQQDEQIYRSNPSNQFGEWKFEEACLEFRPDIVCDIRDWWMLEYQQRSPYRHLFHWSIMPTVDAAPQDEQWLATYSDADSVFTYSDWAIDLLKEQGGRQINLQCSAPPGADFDSFQMVQNKKQHKSNCGLDPESLIVGTVMRNQRRKLYPELIQAFKKFLETAPESIRDITTLYLHTAWPDVGWDIPRLIKESGIGHKILFTYHCRNCGASFPSYFQDARTNCTACGSDAAVFPNSNIGISRSDLSKVMNCFDVYVQYANSEGFGMPQVEAAACGVPVMAVDYSAMSDVVRKLNGTPIDVKHLWREPETHCHRAIPDEDDFLRKLIGFLTKPQPLRQRAGHMARVKATQHYNWDKTAKIWEQHFDELVVRDQSQTWLSEPKYHQPEPQMPKNLDNESFVKWGLTNIAGRPDLMHSYVAQRMVRDLNWGSMTANVMGGQYYNEASTLGAKPKMVPFDREKAVAIWLDMADKNNIWEQRRAQCLMQQE